MKRILYTFVIIVMTFHLFANAETILDQMEMVYELKYDAGYGNTIGGDVFFGQRYAVQMCDDFRTTSTGYVVTEVQVGNANFFGTHPTDVRISIFAEEEGQPSEDPIFTARASELGLQVANEDFVEDIFGIYGVISVVSGLNVCLEPERAYFLDVQVYSGPDDWSYTLYDDDQLHEAETFFRDGPSDEGAGGYGWTDWRAGGEVGAGVGDSAYRIEATSGICCTGGERIAKARCRASNNGNKLTVRLAGGFPGDTFTVDVSSGESKSGTLDAKGKGRVRFKRQPSGEGTASATWSCGASAEAAYTCL